jgi:hypothetical protein
MFGTASPTGAFRKVARGGILSNVQVFAMFPTAADWSAACDDVVSEVLRAAGVNAPPVDAVTVAARCQWPVVWDFHQTGRARLQRLDGRPTLFVRPAERPERLQWAVAHEIGEVLTRQVCQALDLPAAEFGPREREELASQMARRLLLPTGWFFTADEDLFQLKARFATASHELIAWRWLDGETPTAVTIIDRGDISRRRSNFAPRAPAMCAAEQECAAAARTTGVPARRQWRNLRIHAWPVHEPDWQREIVRTIMDDAESAPPDWEGF